MSWPHLADADPFTAGHIQQMRPQDRVRTQINKKISSGKKKKKKMGPHPLGADPILGPHPLDAAPSKWVRIR